MTFIFNSEIIWFNSDYLIAFQHINLNLFCNYKFRAELRNIDF
ncbi:hypothetical protein SAMN05192540_3940 [Maribacter dokdonensis]|uniref:Uncharacterized protein n=1 Tax=Maribacter dokdonensis TaxID=320912 RepID=A0A1H4UXV8_9FLAO|nr:hypothetical protein SAMN05192540_3940 [Maribacter dokdonensis]